MIFDCEADFLGSELAGMEGAAIAPALGNPSDWSP